MTVLSNLSLCRGLVVNALARRMSSYKYSYEEAVHKLNSLQSNKASIEQIRKDIKTGRRCTNIEDMENYLLRTGVSLTKLDELSVIHVAGTKGKGSTSAMCESILRAHGLRTGLYTSPHLVAVRERIRLGGAVVARDEFARHFHRVYDLLYSTQAYEGDMPKYFAFLTVMAYNMFLVEKVDVAVIEVGIGGVVDYTNVLRKVPVVGITALGLDHTSILGTTIEEIAAAKAGVMKPGCEAYTVAQPEAAMDVLRSVAGKVQAGVMKPGCEAYTVAQPEAALDVLRSVAGKVQCPLTIVPEYNAYTFPKDNISHLPVDLEAYKMNASLAIQLSHAWMRQAKSIISNRRNVLKKQVVSGKILRQNEFIEIETPFINGKFTQEAVITTVPKETVYGLKECKWPGRYHVIRSDYAMFYLDGAHTKESMEICAQWFGENNRYRDKVLIFSATGDRDVEVLLNPLKSTDFTEILFVIPKAYKDLSDTSDNYSVMENKDLIKRCHGHAQIWEKIKQDRAANFTVLECVSDALIHIKRGYKDIDNLSVLITGSLHLVGAALSILDPSLSKD